MARPDVTIHDGPLSKRELRDAALVAARAFHTDPFFEFLSPNALQRARGLALYGLATVTHLGPSAKLLTARVDGRIVGVGAWIPPGAYPYPAAVQARQAMGIAHALYRVPSSIPKGLKYLMAIDKAHPKDEVWYLQLLVCDPEHQRRGIGTSLQDEVLATCDHDGVGAYLETQKEANVAYYRRFGYEVVSELMPVAAGPKLWTMRRDPRPAGVT